MGSEKTAALTDVQASPLRMTTVLILVTVAVMSGPVTHRAPPRATPRGSVCVGLAVHVHAHVAHVHVTLDASPPLER